MEREREQSSTAVAFAIAGGSPTDLAPIIHVDPPMPYGRQLIAAVEAVNPGQRATETASVALAAIRNQMLESAGDSTTVAIGKAFAAANAAVCEENRLPTGSGRQRRIQVGASAIVVEGTRALIAQVPPSQVLLIQDGRCYGMPSLASWRQDYEPAIDPLEEPDPLGINAQIVPNVFQTRLSRGDLLILCSTAIAAGLGRALGIDRDDRLRDGCEAPAMIAGDADLALEWLARQAVSLSLLDGFAVCLQIGVLPSPPKRISVRAFGRGAGQAPVAPAGVSRDIRRSPGHYLAARRVNHRRVHS